MVFSDHYHGQNPSAAALGAQGLWSAMCANGGGLNSVSYPRSAYLAAIFLRRLGFSNASEFGVVYLCMVEYHGQCYTSLIASNARVSPIKHLRIPQLELCGACLLAELLYHIKEVLSIPTKDVRLSGQHGRPWIASW